MLYVIKKPNLQTCVTCYSSNYCNDHLEAFEEHHDSSCAQLKLSLLLAIVSSLGVTFTKKFIDFPDMNKPVVDMHSFSQHHIETQTFRFTDYMYTDYVSDPLTVYYGMEYVKLLELPPSNTYIIHIMEAYLDDRRYLASWELFLHLTEGIKNFIVILIGPEIPRESNDIEVCNKCRRHSQTLSFESYHMLYYNYVNSAYYKRPNMIVDFNADINSIENYSEFGF